MSGHFEGECLAEYIQILADGEFKGSLYSQQLVIEPSGHFFGDSHSLADKPASLELVQTEVAKQDLG